MISLLHLSCAFALVLAGDYQRPQFQPVDCDFRRQVGLCSVTCGTGTAFSEIVILRQAENGGLPCPPVTKELVACGSEYNQCPTPTDKQDCYVEYFPQTPCSASCGRGYQMQVGSLVVAPYGGGAACPPLLSILPCQVQECPQDCVVEYPEFGPCSTDCGLGTRRRTGTIVIQPSSDGKPCPELTQVQVCNEDVQCDSQDCIIEFNDETSCSQTCGSGGFKIQIGRVVQEPVGAGRPCPSTFKVTPCTDLPGCPLDCEVEFQESPCSVSCGIGWKQRNATITQQPQFGGKPCPLNLTEVVICNSGCPQECILQGMPGRGIGGAGIGGAGIGGGGLGGGRVMMYGMPMPPGFGGVGQGGIGIGGIGIGGAGFGGCGFKVDGQDGIGGTGIGGTGIGGTGVGGTGIGGTGVGGTGIGGTGIGGTGRGGAGIGGTGRGGAGIGGTGRGGAGIGGTGRGGAGIGGTGRGGAGIGGR